jgi:hypothetical protein
VRHTLLSLYTDGRGEVDITIVPWGVVFNHAILANKTVGKYDEVTTFLPCSNVSGRYLEQRLHAIAHLRSFKAQATKRGAPR